MFFLLKLILLVFLCFLSLLIIAPIIDHLFYIDESEKYISYKKLILYIFLHLIIICLFIYLLHNYIIYYYLKYININVKYDKFKYILDLIIAIILVGLQRNLRHKLTFISNNHPIRSKLIE